MLTDGQKRTLRRVAARSVESGDYSSLYAWVTAFDVRARPFVAPIDDEPIEAIRERFLQMMAPQPSWIDRTLDRLRAWWYGR